MGLHIKALETLNNGTIHHQEEVFSVKSLIKYLVLLALLLPLAHSLFPVKTPLLMMILVAKSTTLILLW